MASRASATTWPADIGIAVEREEVDAACRTVLFGILRTVLFRGGAGLGAPLSTIGRLD